MTIVDRFANCKNYEGNYDIEEMCYEYIEYIIDNNINQVNDNHTFDKNGSSYMISHPGLDNKIVYASKFFNFTLKLHKDNHPYFVKTILDDFDKIINDIKETKRSTGIENIKARIIEKLK